MTQRRFHTDDPKLTRCRHVRLWAFAAWALHLALRWYGTAEQIALRPRVNARFVWDIAPLVARFEALVRRLLLAEAHALADAPHMAATARAVSSKAPENTARPAWRGVLRITLRDGAGTPPARPPPRGSVLVSLAGPAPMLSGPAVFDVLPWARRVDAVTRAIADPLVHARRIAARMRRSNAPLRPVPRPALSRRANYDRDAWRAVLAEAQAAAQVTTMPRRRRESG